MCESVLDVLEKNRVCRLRFLDDGSPVSYADVVQRWRESEGFRERFVGQLVAAPFEAYFWETPPITAASASRPFECVFIDASSLARTTADPGAFQEHLKPGDDDESVVSFWNLGRDAMLVVPRPMGPLSHYAHLAAFSRHAPAAQQHALWQAVGEGVQARLDDRPLWVSTAGLGVPWLHVRLDARPKYYRHDPYRE